MKLKRFVFQTTIGMLMLLTVLTSITAVIITAYSIFNFKPYLNFSEGVTFGFTDFEKGLPMPVTSHWVLADRVTSGPPEWVKEDSIKNIPRVTSLQTKFRIINVRSLKADNSPFGSVRQFRLLAGDMNFETKNTFIRFLLCLPWILYCVWFAFGSWQFSKLLRDIVDGNAFSLANYRRIRNVGFYLIEYQIVLLIYYLFAGYWFVLAEYDFSHPTVGSGSISFKPDYDFSFSWMGIGIMMIIISLAFKTGDHLKQEQDLTI